MLLDTDTYPSGGYLHQPNWATHRFQDQDYQLDHTDACFSPIDRLNPQMRFGLPLTPADTIKGDEDPRKSSLSSDVSPLISPLACKTNSVSHAGASTTNKKIATEVGKTVEEQEDDKLPTPPPEEGAEVPQSLANQFASEQTLENAENIKNKPEESDGYQNQNDNYCDGPSLAPNIGDDPELNVLSSDWDPSNFDFFDAGTAFAPTFMSEQSDGWGNRQHDLPSAYPALPLESAFSNETGMGLAGFQGNSGTALGLPLDSHFGSYVPAQDSPFVSGAFPNDVPAFETRNFYIQPVAKNVGTERTSQRSKSKDQMLVDLKRQGRSYKEIKAYGGFVEAESTLRGRYRTLTKPKEARVRKPEWGDREVIGVLA